MVFFAFGDNLFELDVDLFGYGFQRIHQSCQNNYEISVGSPNQYTKQLSSYRKEITEG